MFKELFQSDNLQINLVLNKDVYQQSELVRGYLKVYNKKMFKIKRIQVDLRVDYFTEDMVKHSFTMYQDVVAYNVNVETIGDTRIPVQYGLPLNVPLSSNYVMVTLIFKLDIPLQMPIQFKRVITVIPSNDTNLLLNAIQSLSFQSTYRSGAFMNEHQIFEFNGGGVYAQQGLENILFNIQYDELYMYINLFLKMYGANRSLRGKAMLIRNNFYDFEGRVNQAYILEQLYSLIGNTIQQSPQNHYYR